MDASALRLSDPTLTPEAKPAQFATARFLRTADGLNEAIEAQHVLTGLLNAVVTFAFWAGMSAADTERLLDVFKAATPAAFKAMQDAHWAKAP